MTSARALDEPSQAATGYGSRAVELCASDCAERHTLEAIENPERVSYWLPKALKDGASAPVVIFMHAFFAPVPEIYQRHIDHLTSQGYIVIFPQYHAASWSLLGETGVFRRADQRQWLAHAIRSTKRALGLIGAVADKTQIYGYGHSLGGILLLGWEKAGGPPLKGMVLAHPKPDLTRGIPAVVRRFLKVTELPWRQMADAVTGRVVLLGGDDDRISTPSEVASIRPFLPNAQSVSLYIAQSDRHAPEVIRADHMNPATDAGMMKHFGWMMKDMGGRILLNTYDYRYYFAALDALLSGQGECAFDMGEWSDGQPFAQVTREF